MAVTEELINELEVRATQVLKLDEMIRRQEAIEAERAASADGERPLEPWNRSSVAGSRLQNPFSNTPTIELKETIRASRTQHQMIAKTSIVARLSVPSALAVIVFAVAGFAGAAPAFLVGIGCALGAYVVDGLIRSWAKRGHVSADQRAWDARRELSRRSGSVSDED